MLHKKYKFCKNNILNKKDFSKFSLHYYKTEIITGILKFIIVHNNYCIPKLGIIIPKKKLQLSNKRNLCKRIIREIFRHNKKIFSYKIIIVILIQKLHELKKENLYESFKEFIYLYNKNFYCEVY